LLLLSAACAKDTDATFTQAPISPPTDEQATDIPGLEPDAAETSAPELADQETPDGADDRQVIKKALETRIFPVGSQDEIVSVLFDAVPYFPEILSLDISALHDADADVVIEDALYNAYYAMLYQFPELKYVYECNPSYEQGSSVAAYHLKYMPYVTGEAEQLTLPADTVYIYKLTDLIDAAINNIGAEQVPIAVMNKELTVDDMNGALGQAGYGYIVYQLGNDGMSIEANPDIGFTMEECVARIDLLKSLSSDIVADITTLEMSDSEKLYAAYQYITANVAYDERYYTDISTMPLESRRAYGALVDNTAICGGFSWAFNMLCEAAGVPCYNVNGKVNGENHLWNYALYEGEYLYFDATADRGLTEYYGSFAKTPEILAFSYTWDEGFYMRLVQ
jgi:hypothetical protein